MPIYSGLNTLARSQLFYNSTVEELFKISYLFSPV